MAFESPQRDDVPLEYDEWVETLHSAARGLDTNVTMTLIDEPMQRLLLEAHCTLLKTLLPALNAVTAAMLSYPFAIVRSQFERLSKFTFGVPTMSCTRIYWVFYRGKKRTAPWLEIAVNLACYSTLGIPSP